MWVRASLLAILVCLSPVCGSPLKPLDKIEKCTLVPTEWADGDSFQVRFPDKKLHTIRLYGVDCMEMQVSDETDFHRLRVQRRYFGITEIAPKPLEAIEIAKGFGKQAAEMTASLLDKPFTVYTRFRDALGDGKHKRIYAFVTCADGRDLASLLVEAGLARAYGVDDVTPDGRTKEESAAMLADLELQSAIRDRGIWAKTYWDKLPAERRIQRMEDEEVKVAIGKQPLPEGFKLDPNNAARDQLMRMPGIGEEMADRIIENQPYEKADDLLEVNGLGPKKLAKIRPFLEFPKK